MQHGLGTSASLLRPAISAALLLGTLGTSQSFSLATDRCAQQQHALDVLEATVNTDEDKIRHLNTSVTGDELDAWAEANDVKVCLPNP